ncbi:MAG: Uma2 family endonuclease [Gemmatimonadaceae bacterium]
MAAPLYYTADMVRDLTDESRPWPRYETVYGELLVSPAPRLWHQTIVTRLVLALGNYLAAQPVGQVLSSPSDISWGSDRLLQPDVFVVPAEEARTLNWSRIRTLLLAAEVLSPSSIRADRFTKRRLYQEAAVPLYWVLDGDAHVVEIWTPDAQFPRAEREQLVWTPQGAQAPFTVDLEDLFGPI